MRIDQIEIHAGTVDFPYEAIRQLEAKCEARTNFSKTPTITDANAKLQEMAASIGANAVVDVAYDHGMSLTSWRSLKATGLAVRKLADEVPCPRCAEPIKRAARVCRFCGAEIGDNIVAQAPVLAAHRTPTNQPIPRIAEPLKATDNSMSSIMVIVGILAVLMLIGILANS